MLKIDYGILSVHFSEPIVICEMTAKVLFAIKQDLAWFLPFSCFVASDTDGDYHMQICW